MLGVLGSQVTRLVGRGDVLVSRGRGRSVAVVGGHEGGLALYGGLQICVGVWSPR